MGIMCSFSVREVLLDCCSILFLFSTQPCVLTISPIGVNNFPLILMVEQIIETLLTETTRILCWILGLTCGTNGKESVCQCRRLQLEPRVGNSIDRGAWQVKVYGVAKSWTGLNMHNTSLKIRIIRKTYSGKEWPKAHQFYSILFPPKKTPLQLGWGPCTRD